MKLMYPFYLYLKDNMGNETTDTIIISSPIPRQLFEMLEMLVESFRLKMNERFDKMDTQIDKIIAKLDKNMGEMDERFNEMATQMDKIIAKLDKNTSEKCN